MHMHKKKTVIRAILALYPRTGATYDEISDDFLMLEYEPLGYTYQGFFKFMSTMEDVECTRDFYGNIHWMSTSSKSSHIRQMVGMQKSGHRRKKGTTITPCNFDGPFKRDSRGKGKPRYQPYIKNPKARFSAPSRSDEESSASSDENAQQNQYYPHLYEHQIIGDDFFLEIARIEMGFKTVPGSLIQKSGMCVSGQTIRNAIKTISQMPKGSLQKVIINLGSVDLLHGRNFLEIQSDYNELLGLLKYAGVQVIPTTLPPIGNFASYSNLKMNWEKVNKYLRAHENCVDISNLLIQNQKIIWSCYQGAPKNVTGSSRPHVLWNKIGRQLILKSLKSYLNEQL